jgi:hypothetical protein
MESWAFKKGRSAVANWKHRFVSFDRDTSTVSYFTAEGSVGFKGSVAVGTRRWLSTHVNSVTGVFIETD